MYKLSFYVPAIHELIAAVVNTLKQAHPYETPAYNVWQLAEL